MKTGVIITFVAAIALGLFGLYFVNIEQTEEGRMPEISIEGGQAPEFEVKTGDVLVGETEVTVPTLDVESAEEAKSNETN